MPRGHGFGAPYKGALEFGHIRFKHKLYGDDIFRDVTFQEIGNRRFADFLSEEGNYVKRRRPGSLFSPLE
jgi:hypothetical protein